MKCFCCALVHREQKCLLLRLLTYLWSNTWRLFWSDGGLSQSQDDSIVGTRHCRHSLAIMPIPGTLSSSSPDLLQPTTSMLDFSNPSGNFCLFYIALLITNRYIGHLSLVQQILDLLAALFSHRLWLNENYVFLSKLEWQYFFQHEREVHIFGNPNLSSGMKAEIGVPVVAQQ